MKQIIMHIHGLYGHKKKRTKIEEAKYEMGITTTITSANNNDTKNEFFQAKSDDNNKQKMKSERKIKRKNV